MATIFGGNCAWRGEAVCGRGLDYIMFAEAKTDFLQPTGRPSTATRAAGRSALFFSELLARPCPAR